MAEGPGAEGPDGPTRQPVVVAVDGSPESLVALRWAFDYGQLAGLPVSAAIVWETNAGFGFAAKSYEGLGDEARRTLEEAVRKVLGDDWGPLRLEVLQGNPHEVLIERSRDAQLLVVGARGYSSVAGLLLGHTGEACVRHAACSVVVARSGPEGAPLA